MARYTNRGGKPFHGYLSWGITRASLYRVVGIYTGIMLPPPRNCVRGLAVDYIVNCRWTAGVVVHSFENCDHSTTILAHTRHKDWLPTLLYRVRSHDYGQHISALVGVLEFAFTKDRR